MTYTMIYNLIKFVDTSIPFGLKKTIPTLDKILSVIKNDDDPPDISRSNPHKLLKCLDFVYTKRNRHSALIEKDEIILWRRRYMLNVRKYREEGRRMLEIIRTIRNS